MDIIRLSEKEVSALRDMTPDLEYNAEKGIISGILSFKLTYSELQEEITDSYQIEIDLNNVSSGLPIVRETAGRIRNIAKKQRKSALDLHINEKNELCMIIAPEIPERYPNGFDLQELIRHIQEHLYWVSYVERHNKEPWQGYGHGIEGYLQLYHKDTRKYAKDVMSIIKGQYGCESRAEIRRKLKELIKEYKI
jgi:hypothetical protein